MFTFSYGFHGDIVLQTENPFNLGYNYVQKMPLVPWLHILNTDSENFFNVVPTTPLVNLDRLLEGDLEQLMPCVEEIVRAPLSVTDFNDGIAIANLSSFCAGNNRTRYEWELQDDRKLYLTKKDEKVLSLDSNQSRNFITDYLQFLSSDPEKEYLYHTTNEVIRRIMQKL